MFSPGPIKLRLVNKTFFQVSGQDQDFCIQVSSKTKTSPTKVSRQDQDFGILVSSKTKTFPPKVSRQEQDLAPNSYALGKYTEFMNKYYHWHQLFNFNRFVHASILSSFPGLLAVKLDDCTETCCLLRARCTYIMYLT